jgi:hypothetical protein
MKQSLPRWSRRHCEHPHADLIRMAGGLVISEVCPSCGAELSATIFDTAEDALDALRDALSVTPEPAPAPTVEPVRQPARSMLWEPVTDFEPYGVSIPAVVLEMGPVLPWPRARNRE